jgi:hypothetical protein
MSEFMLSRIVRCLLVVGIAGGLAIPAPGSAVKIEEITVTA